MAYSTVDTVGSLFRDITFDTDTAVTTAEVELMISEVDAEIDAKLSDHYNVPIVGTESLKILGKISRLKVAHLIKTILESTNENSDRVQDVQTNLEKKADALLNDIIPTYKNGEWVDPVIQLPDADRVELSPKTGNLFQSNTRAPEIKRGGDNW